MDKHPLETNNKLSIAYGMAFPEPISKHKIQKQLTKSARYEPIFEQYKNYFVFTKRKDKRLGKFIQSKPEILIEYIKTKINLTKKEEEQLLILLKDKDFKSSLKLENITLDTQFIINTIFLIFMSDFISNRYRTYKDKKGQLKILDIKIQEGSNKFYKKFIKTLNDLLPEIKILKKYQNKIDNFERIGSKLNTNFKEETILKFLLLNPENAITIYYCITSLAFAETCNYYK